MQPFSKMYIPKLLFICYETAKVCCSNPVSLGNGDDGSETYLVFSRKGIFV